MALCEQALERRGYAVSVVLADAQWYGLPQRRKRVYLICIDANHTQLSLTVSDFFAKAKATLRHLYLPVPSADARPRVTCHMSWNDTPCHVHAVWG